MDKQTGIAAVVATVTGLVSAGAFKFYEFALKQKREIAKDEQTDKAMYRDDLIKRVEKLEEERAENLSQIMDLMMSITAMSSVRCRWTIASTSAWRIVTRGILSTPLEVAK